MKESIITVTGGTGMVGSHLIAELLSRRYRIKALIRQSSNIEKALRTFKLMNVGHLADHIEWIVVELNNPLEMRDVLRGTEILFHCAAMVSYDDLRSDEIISSNVEMTTCVTQSALAAQVGLLVYVSSIATLGAADAQKELIDEESILTSISGRSPYSKSKFFCENIVRRSSIEGLKTIVVNPSIIIGEGDWKCGSGPLIAKAANGAMIYTTGVKGFVDVRDVVRAMADLAFEPKAIGERFIISAGNISFRELFDKAAIAAGGKRPMLKLGRRVLEAVMYIEQRIKKISGRKPLLSKSLVDNALDKSYYDGRKLSKFINFAYTPLDKTIKRVSKQYKIDCK